MWDDDDSIPEDVLGNPASTDIEPDAEEDEVAPFSAPGPVLDIEFPEVGEERPEPPAGTLTLVTPPEAERAAVEPEGSNVHRLVRFHVTIKDIEPLREQYAAITFDDLKGYEAGRKAIAHCRGTRTRIDKRRKELVADALAYHRNVNAVAKELTAAIESIEDPLQAKKDAVDLEKARIKREAEEAKQRELEEKIRAEREAEEARLKAERDAEDARRRAEQEAEQARLTEERKALEGERERARVESERIEKEQAAKRLELDAEAERLKAERERIAAQNRAEEERIAEERRQLEEAKRKVEREEAERQAKIRAEQEAKERAERERVEAEERRVAEIERQAQLAKRLEALRPDKEKLLKFAEALLQIELPECAEPEAKAAVEKARIALGNIVIELESFGEAAHAAA
jgi:chromosome segregation ATPase